MLRQEGGDVARVQITIDDACDPCWTKRIPRESTASIRLDGKTWYLCEEHEKALAGLLAQQLGDPTEGSDG